MGKEILSLLSGHVFEAELNPEVEARLELKNQLGIRQAAFTRFYYSSYDKGIPRGSTTPTIGGLVATQVPSGFIFSLVLRDALFLLLVLVSGTLSDHAMSVDQSSIYLGLQPIFIAPKVEVSVKPLVLLPVATQPVMTVEKQKIL